MAVFGDWRGLSCRSAGLELDISKVYYWHGKAHGLKGLLGGTHGHLSFFDDRWFTVEITDEETLEYQDCEIIYRNTNEYQKRGVFISTRQPDQLWFGNKVTIVDNCYQNLRLLTVIDACDRYPQWEFDMVRRNCNTFVSFMIYWLGLDLKKPFISVGFKSLAYWQNMEIVDFPGLLKT